MKFIFEIIIKPGHTVEEYKNAWEKGSVIIQKEPGAMGTILHRRINHPDRLLAIACWQSKELRDAAMERLEGADEETKALIHAHREFGTFNFIGEFDETEWIVDNVSSTG